MSPCDSLIDCSCPSYPELLRRTCDRPEALWVLGPLTPQPCVAIVGSRDCTAYGRAMAAGMARELARAGLVVVSGLARGIDAAAHRGAILGGGPTIAVLPGGLRPVYPARHAALARQIVATGGALVAEHPPGTQVAPWHFPKRNRIIAGMCHAVLVVEAAARSGARITADLALGYGREVLVVPGPITAPTSVGCNGLLAEGAHPCRGVDDILEALPGPAARTSRALLVARADAAPAPLGEVESRVLAACRGMGGGPVERVQESTGIATSTLLRAVTALELRGLVRVVGAGRVQPVVGPLSDVDPGAREPPGE